MYVRHDNRMSRQLTFRVAVLNAKDLNVKLVLFFTISTNGRFLFFAAWDLQLRFLNGHVVNTLLRNGGIKEW